MKKIIKTTVNIEKEIMKDLKIMAFDKEMTQNDLINRYIVEGLSKDKE
jgi:predicted DNA-binding ribbon-helix-helix protein